MKELVIVPTYKREELLWLCLEAIRREDALIPVYVFSDHAEDSKDFAAVCHGHFCTPMVRPEHNYFGNSYNVIESMRALLRAYSELEILHLIEDDTILHPGYFSWARAKLANGNYQAVCGHIGNHLDTWYTSPCASWNVACLRKCLEFVPEGYFCETREGMQKILDECEHFKASRFRYGSAEQDGFFLRCIEHFGWRTAFPEKPLCTHLGWHGYNRPRSDGPVGTLPEKIAWTRKLLADTRRRYELFGQRITDAEMAGANQ